jgi:hypothetical protein
LICTGLVSVDVVQRPRVRIVVTPKYAEIDGNGPMIRGLVQRDGGVIADVIAAARTSQGIRNALEADGVDIVLVIGGTGPGTMPQPRWPQPANFRFIASRYDRARRPVWAIPETECP